MSKPAFLAALRSELVARYPWAHNPDKLNRFMETVESTIHGHSNSWNKEGEASDAAWKAIGMTGKPTYKALRALPDVAPPTPDAETLEQLRAFAKKEGRNWKETLLYTYWMRGEPVPGFPLLYGLRNHRDFGPTWLDDFKLPKD